MSLLPPPDSEPELLLDLTIRFSTNLPDLLLSVPEPSLSTTSTLKQLIRTHLAPELSNRRIRLVHAGRALVDGAPLSSSLRLPSSRTPSSRPSTPLPDHHHHHHAALSPPSSAKGKTPIRDPPSLSRIYIHCSIGDATLSPRDLAEEARLAAARQDAEDLSVSRESPAANAIDTDTDTAATTTTATTTINTTPAPRGFDRLLAAGFTLPEVQSLRSQFLAVQAHTRTSAEMPSPDTLRELEDRWLDNSGEGGLANGGGGGGGGDAGNGGFVDDDGQSGALDDMLWGTVVGFFWPLGCLLWLCREEGVWSRRRKVAVVVGVVVNAGFGAIRWLK